MLYESIQCCILYRLQELEKEKGSLLIKHHSLETWEAVNNGLFRTRSGRSRLRPRLTVRPHPAGKRWHWHTAICTGPVWWIILNFSVVILGCPSNVLWVISSHVTIEKISVNRGVTTRRQRRSDKHKDPARSAEAVDLRDSFTPAVYRDEPNRDKRTGHVHQRSGERAIGGTAGKQRRDQQRRRLHANDRRSPSRDAANNA